MNFEKKTGAVSKANLMQFLDFLFPHRVKKGCLLRQPF